MFILQAVVVVSVIRRSSSRDLIDWILICSRGIVPFQGAKNDSSNLFQLRTIYSCICPEELNFLFVARPQLHGRSSWMGWILFIPICIMRGPGMKVETSIFMSTMFRCSEEMRISSIRIGLHACEG
ncbi:hypothetical protein BDV40DRAFT_54722 [Aspergillus tamarii]|uniref:Uncharacterized protein n=1 Tax=Aspergillus tamarii TaxID=41984 RepID=A0A5N6UF53_ASPTM|nr:hypothetical protein BDV40DRAFT_54722 [Aspergillus tamarii]